MQSSLEEEGAVFSSWHLFTGTCKDNITYLTFSMPFEDGLRQYNNRIDILIANHYKFLVGENIFGIENVKTSKNFINS